VTGDKNFEHVIGFVSCIFRRVLSDEFRIIFNDKFLFLIEIVKQFICKCRQFSVKAYWGTIFVQKICWNIVLGHEDSVIGYLYQRKYFFISG